jgi:hypothetical protein
MVCIDSLIAALFLSYWNVTATCQFVVLCGLCDAVGTFAGPASLPPLCVGAALCSLQDRRLVLPFLLTMDNIFAASGAADAVQDGVASAALAAAGLSLGSLLPPLRSWLHHATSAALEC